ncbi:MAG: glycosyltransferase [Myxococcota bacterium]|nr:glycosyltransferase [Myxococcota bacterium]
MKILVIGVFDLETDESHIAQTLEQMGHDVVRWRPQRGGGHRKRFGGAAGAIVGLWDAAISRAPVCQTRRLRSLLETCEVGVDLTIVCHDFLTPFQVAKLKEKTGTPVVLWFLDHVGVFGKGMFMAANYDYRFFKDPYIVAVLTDQYGLGNVYYLPECCNVHALGEARPSEEYSCDIAIDGSLHAFRVSVLSRLSRYRVKVWGDSAPWWIRAPGVDAMSQHRFVAGEEKAVALCSAAIVLNTLHPAEIWGVNRRAFEAAGAGAFQLLHWKPGLSQLFEDGSEVVSFRTIDELGPLIDYYLGHPEERAPIARAGRIRAFSDHTFDMRLELMFATVGGAAHGYERPEMATA